MKKSSLFFIVMALAMFVFVFAASAQDAELPAIDEAKAEPYLGVWYMDKMCFGEDCMEMAALGTIITMTMNADNSVVMENENAEPETTSWYMENDVAYLINVENGAKQTSELKIDENGSLVLGGEEFSMYYVRELTPAAAEQSESSSQEGTAGGFSFTDLLNEETVQGLISSFTDENGNIDKVKIMSTLQSLFGGSGDDASGDGGGFDFMGILDNFFGSSEPAETPAETPTAAPAEGTVL